MYSEFQIGIDSTSFPPYLVEDGAYRKDLGVGSGNVKGHMGKGKGIGTVREPGHVRILSFQLELSLVSFACTG